MLVCIFYINMQINSATTVHNYAQFPETGRYLTVYTSSDYGQHPVTEDIPTFENGRKKTYILNAFSFVALSVSALFLIMSVQIRKKISDERKKAIDEKKADNTAIRNLVYNLKTPLSLIYNPIKEIVESGRPDIITTTKLKSVIRQADLMTHMVNIIMEETDEGIEKKGICTESVDLNDWIGYLTDEFIVTHEDRNIVIKTEPDLSIDSVILDKTIISDAINAVMECILSHCTDDFTMTFRTTEKKGYYLVSIECPDIDIPFDKETFSGNNGNAKRNDEKKQTKLPEARIRMNLLGGDIMARFVSDKSSILFQIRIPVIPQSEISLTEGLARPYRYESEKPIHEINDNSKEFETSNSTLLIADDQQELLDYMKKELHPFFKNIYTVPDGKMAYDTIISKIPDVVISDIIMPRMNGFDLCRKIKADPELFHIPVILLTSRTNPKVQELGYKLGADVYIAKPFDLNLLYKVICSQIKNRQQIKKQYSGKPFSDITTATTPNAADEKFIIKLTKLIKDNISNPLLDVSFLVEKLHMSRTALFMKANHLLGLSAARYIKQIKIETAKEQLIKTDKQINEIAYYLGFNDCQYFKTVFKQETGMTPKQFKKKNELNRIS